MLFNSLSSGDLDTKKIIRLSLIAELDAINLYEHLLRMPIDEEAKNVLKHLIEDEQEHVVLLLQKLLKEDEGFYEKLSETST